MKVLSFNPNQRDSDKDFNNFCVLFFCGNTNWFVSNHGDVQHKAFSVAFFYYFPNGFVFQLPDILFFIPLSSLCLLKYVSFYFYYKTASSADDYNVLLMYICVSLFGFL